MEMLDEDATGSRHGFGMAGIWVLGDAGRLGGSVGVLGTPKSFDNEWGLCREGR